MNVLFKWTNICEPAEEDEENAYNVTITENMNPEDVMKQILEIVQKIDT